MSEKPILLFLHGVGKGDRDGSWERALDASLKQLGYPGLKGARTIAPKYSWALIGGDDDHKLPPVTIKSFRGAWAEQHRRRFERSVGAMETMLGRRENGSEVFGANAVVDAAFLMPSFVQAQRYVRKESVRAHVLHRVLQELPPVGRLVIVGHSLGSVVAADLIRRLPPGLEVAGLITIGSPLAGDAFNVPKLRGILAQPPANLVWWISFWNSGDNVTLHKGVSSIFPYMLDYRIPAALPPHSHSSRYYLGDQRVATAIGYALFGSQSKGLTKVEKGMDVPLDIAETFAVIALRYAHLICDALKPGEKRERYQEALRLTQAMTYETIKDRNREIGRMMPSAINELAVDLADVDSVAQVPAPVQAMSKEELVVPLISIRSTNILRPIEISISKEIQVSAMEQLTLSMGLGTEIGDEVFKAADEARQVLRKRVELEWWQWIAVGLGAAALVVGTGGVALAAAPGAAGAAAITSALAAFGPGGMMGGLLTAGALVGVGSSGIAVGGMAMGLASSAASAATVEAVVASQLTAAILRNMQGLAQDPGVWEGLVEIGIQVRRERSRIEALSDDSAPITRELKRKEAVINAALSYLSSKNLAPHSADPWAAED